MSVYISIFKCLIRWNGSLSERASTVTTALVVCDWIFVDPIYTLAFDLDIWNFSDEQE